MNNGKLLLATAVIVGTALITVPVLKNKMTSAYVPLKEVHQQEEMKDANGSAAWWHSMLQDENGQVNLARMSQVREQVALQSMRKSTNAWPLTFSEIGPDNVGGRTRAICIDRNNTQHIFAGGVSGGLFESFDGGSSWTHKAASDQYDVLTITSIIQAADGVSWYFGTGEGLYYAETGMGTSGFIGGGVWKSTDNGNTFARLTSTTVTTPSSTGYAWAAVGKLGADPVNANRIYAGTLNGFFVSNDGGGTWTLGGATMVGSIYDVDVATNGNVYVIVNTHLWKSSTGAVGSYTLVPGSSGYPTANIGRTEIAVSPSDPNYVYAVMGSNTSFLLGAYCSIDGGTTWQQIAGPNNSVFAPFGTNGQAGYDMAFAVDPFDKTRVVLGGVSLWQWKMVNSSTPIYGQWTQIAFEFPDSPSNPQYVHSDKHIIVFHPTHNGTFYIGCDGGIFRTLDGGMTYIPMNKYYKVTQCYGVASDYTAPSRNVAFAGCQDNGTQFVDGLGNTVQSATAIGGGDGGNVEMSFLNPNAMFETVYYGTCDRSSNRGAAFASFYNARISSNANLGKPGFANFVTSIRLWESLHDVNTKDSVRFAATKQQHNLTQGNGTTLVYHDTLKPNYNGILQPNASIIPGSLIVTAGSVTMMDNGAGVLSGSAGSGSITYANNRVTMTFTNPPAVGTLIKLNYDITYNAGVQIYMQSHTNNLGFSAACPLLISSLGPNDTTYVKDYIQSKLAVGFSGANGVYVTRKPLDFSTTPVWVKVASPHSIPDAFSTGNTVQELQWSPDGNTLYLGTDGGQVYRIDNAGSVTSDTTLSDVDKHVSSGDTTNVLASVRCHLIGNFGSSFTNVITAMDIDPNNADRLMVTIGGYTGGNHVYICNNASTAPSDLSSNTNFTSVQGTLPAMPVYACSFDKYNPNYAMIGTDYGVYTTSNVMSGTWAPMPPAFPKVPTVQIRQSRWDPWNGCVNAGVFYIATHGRGMWKSENSYVPMGIQDHPSVNRNPGAPVINVFPNPMSDNGHVSFHLNERGDVHLRIYTLKGQLVKDMLLSKQAEGDATVEFDASELSSGTYLMSFESGQQKGASRFVVLK